MNDVLMIRTAGLEDINTIGYLAYQVWPTAYKDILTFEQLHYMLQHFYSPASLREQMVSKQHVFVIAEKEDDQPLGFASYSAIKEGVYKLHKLYVLPLIQGKNVGRTLLEAVEDDCRELGAKKLILNVNRFNKAKHFYEKLGYAITGEEKVDIGNGFVQDDYVMEKDLGRGFEPF
ncbi:MAG TPA: GNAT family N-acetyltransferase [Chitinophagaceae bacterium]|nr:GNAT family N-acetyltransferase [Chitinophagaceae bacterium]